MRNMYMKIFMAFVVFSLLGCASTWVNNDNSVASDIKIAEAKRACKVDDMIYDWEFKGYTRKLLVNMQTTDAAKEKLEQSYEEQENAMYKEIESCMSKEGLKKK